MALLSIHYITLASVHLMPNRMLVTVAVDAPIATFVGQLIGVVLPENHPDLIGGARGRRGNSDGRGLQPETS